jgi:hypothetical protein
VARRLTPVLVDTNVFLEAFRGGSWKALTGGYRVETVEACLIETQTGTGFQKRRSEVQIDEVELRARLTAVHKVTLAEEPRS